MRFDEPLTQGILLKRYKRFLADVKLADGSTITSHCANPGSMRGVSNPGSAVYLSHSKNPARKLPWTLEAIRVGRYWIGINPQRANALAEQAWRRGLIPELKLYPKLRREPRIDEKSRADFLLTNNHGKQHWVEAKYVTMSRGKRALFPDSVSDRAAKHMRSLAAKVREGDLATVLFVCPRADVDTVGPAWEIDPAYGSALAEALEQGVQVLSYQVKVGKNGIRWQSKLKFKLR